MVVVCALTLGRLSGKYVKNIARTMRIRTQRLRPLVVPNVCLRRNCFVAFVINSLRHRGAFELGGLCVVLLV